MPTQLNVLFLPPPPYRDRRYTDDVVSIVGARHKLRIYESGAPLAPQFEDLDAVIDEGGHGTQEMADAAQGLRLWQLYGSGHDDFDIEYWKHKGIPVANCPGHGHARALAECALLYILMLARSWHFTQRNMRAGEQGEPMGLELENRLLGLIGFGATGREVARLTKPLGMKIMAVDERDISLDEQREFGLESVAGSADIDKVIGKSDYLSLHLHVDKRTRHIIDARRLRLMKPGACLINVSRGALVDEAALYSALHEGWIGGAGLDVFSEEPVDPNHPLLTLPNVVATPHVSGATDGTSRRRALFVRENLDRIAQGLEPLSRIDL